MTAIIDFIVENVFNNIELLHLVNFLSFIKFVFTQNDRGKSTCRKILIVSDSFRKIDNCINFYLSIESVHNVYSTFTAQVKFFHSSMKATQSLILPL